MGRKIPELKEADISVLTADQRNLRAHPELTILFFKITDGYSLN